MSEPGTTIRVSSATLCFAANAVDFGVDAVHPAEVGDGHRRRPARAEADRIDHRRMAGLRALERLAVRREQRRAIVQRRNLENLDAEARDDRPRILGS